MKYSTLCSILLMAVLCPLTLRAQAPASSPNRYVGDYEGVMDAGAARLKLRLTIERDASLGLRGAMISVDQGNTRMPGTIIVQRDSLLVVLPAANAHFKGALNAKGDTLRGVFTQGASFDLVMHRIGAIQGANRPQEPKAPFPYQAMNLTVSSVPGVTLDCTTAIPAGAGPFPGVVFATGSGPQNRDEELMEHKPFLVISDYLARHGIASMRCDDRGTGKSTGNFAAATTADFSNDVQAALEALRRNSAVNPGRVGIIGHSEGGMIAPMIAARSRDVAFLVLLAGPGMRIDSLMLMQQQLAGRAAGATSENLAMGARLNSQIFRILRESDPESVSARVDTVIRAFVATLPPQAQSEATRTQLHSQLASSMTPWFRYFIRYEPSVNLRAVHVPVLALNGTLDVQVPYKEDLAGIRDALTRAGNKDFETLEFRGLNHLFQTAHTGAVSEYAEITETISPAVLDKIGMWINRRFAAKVK